MAQMTEPQAEFSDESARLEVVESFDAEALEGDAELQAIVDFAAKLCGAPVSVVTLLEQETQRFLAKQGIEDISTPRKAAFCNQTIGSDEMLEVMDATVDPRFADNPLVTDPPDIRYYAGQPLVSEEGASLGTLCVIDTKAHDEPLSDFQRQGMAVLAQAAIRRLEARRSAKVAERTIAEREERLRRMIEGVPQIAWSADADGNFDYFNGRWKEVTGTEAPRVSSDWRPFVHPDDADEVFAEWQRCFAASESFEVEYRLKQADGSWEWVLSLAVPVAERGGDAVRWFGTLTDIHEVRAALEERDLLTHELSHRIKNIFAVVIGLATLKARNTPEHAPFAKELTDVLSSLGRAHEFVRPHGSGHQESLQGLLTTLFSPYIGPAGPRVKVSGIDTEVSARAATPIALVFHELATNSAKYGALSVDGGHVTLEAEDCGDTIALTWREHCGPPVSDGGHRGFGSRLVEMSVTGQLQGTWERHFERDGLVAELTMAKAALAD